MPTPLAETGLKALRFARHATLALLEDIPSDKLLFQLFPRANHALWVMGHLACTDEFFLHKVGGKPVNRFEEWKDLFFMGSTPMARMEDYPPAPTVRETLVRNREQLLAWFEAMNEAELLRPFDGDMAQFAENRAMLMSTLAWHEGMHAGQLTTIRKALGLQPKFA